MRKAALVLVALFALAFLFVGCGKSEKDKTAPALSAISTSGVTTTSVVVTWTTDEAATSQVEYGLASSYGSTTTLDTDLVTSHSVNLTGLTAGTTYHYRADSTDAAGNKGVSADFTFSTSSAGPVIALVAVSSVTSTGATITWTTDEAATSQVEYGLTSSYGSTTTLDTNLVTNHSVNLTGLTAGTAYHYRVRSKDAAAQETLSGDATFTTSAGGGPTYHSGTISSAETWKAADNPHMVTSKVYVESTLTLEPGVVVKFNTGMGLVIGYNNPGALAAAGTQALPITFTSAASTPSPGDWDGISFEGRTIDSTTKLDYCLIEYGGGNTYGNIYCTDASPTVTNCTIKYGSNYGVYSYGAGGFNSFANNTVTQNTKFPLRVEAEYARTIGSGNTLTGNTTDGIEVSSGEITSSGTWLSQSVPYIIAGDLDLSGTASPALTITAGSTLKFRGNAGIDVGYNNPGALVAVGTAGSPITFTSAVSPASPGDWDGITFWGSTVDSTTKLDYCVIEYGGNNTYGNIYCNDVSPTITNCTIRYGSNYGVYSYGAGGFNSFANNTVTQNTKFPLRVEAEYVRTIGSGNTLTGNTTDGIEVSSGEITSSGTWLSQSVPYIIAGDLDLSGTAGPVLTIAAGNTLKFRANAGIDVGYNNPGALVAVGTAGSLITFTSAVSPASPGDWDGITFWDGTIDGTTKLDYCVIEYGGGNGYGNIYCNDASPTITNCAINYSSTWGIWQGTTPPTMSGNTFTGNASGDVGGP